MQAVSKEYQDSMKSPLRERSYIQVSFGLINQEAQSSGYVEPYDFTDWSINYRQPFSAVVIREKNYVTCENNFTRVDGSQYLIPRWLYISDDNKMGNCMVSNTIVTISTPFVFKIHVTLSDIKGLTLYFGDNYPTDFTIKTNTSQTLKVTGNDKAEWTTMEAFDNVHDFTITVTKMKVPSTRFRLFAVTMGIGLSFDNNKITDSTLDFDMSPIGEYISQIDFGLTIDNKDKFFDIDNPKSAINFIETGQEMTVAYGYQLPDTNTIEWVKGATLDCCDWEANDSTATIRCQDKLRALNKIYHQDKHIGTIQTLFEYAERVFNSADITKYRISPSLKQIKCSNPIPLVNHKEALQIIANASRCVLLQDRDGVIEIKSNYIPTLRASTVAETSFSNVANVTKGTDSMCSVLTKDYLRVDGSPRLIPKSGKLTNGGYISSGVSDSTGQYPVDTSITIYTDTIGDYWELSLDFASALPSEIVIDAFLDEVHWESFTIGSDEISEHTKIYRPIKQCSYMNIRFTKSAIPYNRVLVDKVTLSSDTNFNMNRDDMTSSPKVNKEELVKEIIVPTYKYVETSEVETLWEETVGIGNGWTYEYTNDAPHGSYQVTVDGEYNPYVVVYESGAYYVKLVCSKNITSPAKIKLVGTKYDVIEDKVVERIQERGKTITWDNPLMSDSVQASNLAKWIADHYREGVTYEYNTRGNPELDVNDIITQDNNFVEDMKVNVTRASIKFNQSLSGKVTTRRKGGTNGVANT